MATPSIVTDARLNDLATVLQIPVTEMREFAESLTNADSSIFTVEQISDAAFSNIGDPDAASLFVRILFYLHHFKPLHGWETGEIIENVRSGIAERKVELTQAFDERADIMSSLLDSAAYQLAAKTVALTSDRVEQISNISIITDIRPVFDDTRSDIIGSLILNSLRIHVSNSDRESVSFALDFDSIVELRKKCDLAIKKTIFSKKFFEASSGKTAVVVGDDEIIGDEQ